MSKNSYREYFASVRKYVKMKPFLELASITNANFSYFMKGESFNHLISIEKFQCLESLLKDTLQKIV